MSRNRMIFWAVIAVAAVLFGISARQNDLQVSRRAERNSTDRPEGGYLPGQEGTTVVGRSIRQLPGR